VKKSQAWNRKLWAILFSSGDGTSFIIGEAWYKIRPEAYPGEPGRVLLFRTRTQARKWSIEMRGEYSLRTDFCADWKFRPVRVREIVAKLEEKE
jgi:hypothetical protein